MGHFTIIVTLKRKMRTISQKDRLYKISRKPFRMSENNVLCRKPIMFMSELV